MNKNNIGYIFFIAFIFLSIFIMYKLLRNGDFKQVHFSQVRELVEKDAYFLDVRPPEDFAVGHLEKAVNIPLGALNSVISKSKSTKTYIYLKNFYSKDDMANNVKKYKNTELIGFIPLEFFEYYLQ